MTTISDTQVRDYVEGKRELRELLPLAPGYLEQLKGRAQFFLDGGHHERALIMLEMLEELDRKDKLVTLLAIDTLLKLGRSDAAEEKVARLLARDPNDPDALVAKAEVLIASGSLVKAAELLGRVQTEHAQSAAAARASAVATRAYELVESVR